jgi:hypothetical protein
MLNLIDWIYKKIEAGEIEEIKYKKAWAEDIYQMDITCAFTEGMMQENSTLNESEYQNASDEYFNQYYKHKK